MMKLPPTSSQRPFSSWRVWCLFEHIWSNLQKADTCLLSPTSSWAPDRHWEVQGLRRHGGSTPFLHKLNPCCLSLFCRFYCLASVKRQSPKVTNLSTGPMFSKCLSCKCRDSNGALAALMFEAKILVLLPKWVAVGKKLDFLALFNAAYTNSWQETRCCLLHVSQATERM